MGGTMALFDQPPSFHGTQIQKYNFNEYCMTIKNATKAEASHVTVTYWDCDPMLTPVRSPMLPV